MPKKRKKTILALNAVQFYDLRRCVCADCKHEYSVGHNISIKGSIYPLIVARTSLD